MVYGIQGQLDSHVSSGEGQTIKVIFVMYVKLDPHAIQKYYKVKGVIINYYRRKGSVSIWPGSAVLKRDPDDSFLSLSTTLYLLTNALNLAADGWACCSSSAIAFETLIFQNQLQQPRRRQQAMWCLWQVLLCRVSRVFWHRPINHWGGKRTRRFNRLTSCPRPSQVPKFSCLLNISAQLGTEPFFNGNSETLE